MKDNPTRTTIQDIDMEQGFLSPSSPHCIPAAAATVPALCRALDTARAKGIAVFFVKRLYRADGSDVELTRWEGWRAGGRSMTPGSQESEALRRRRAFAHSRGITPSSSPDGVPFSRQSWI